MIERFFARRRYRRFRRQMRERIVLLIFLGLFILNCCVCMGLGLITSALQEIGILPTYTPTPVVPVEPTDVQSQGSALVVPEFALFIG